MGKRGPGANVTATDKKRRKDARQLKWYKKKILGNQFVRWEEKRGTSSDEEFSRTVLDL